jgi:hypothetical protein
MTYCDEVAIEMPDSFPCDELTRLRAAARDLLTPQKPPAWAEFAGASNLIAWRFRSFVESSNDALVAPGATHDEIYRQEQMLFLAACSAVSCVEAMGYATHALASDPQVLGLPFGPDEQRRSNPATVRDLLTRNVANRAVTQPWVELADACEWNLLRDLRIRMFHRSNLPRIVTGTMGGPPPPASPTQYASTSSTPALTVDEVPTLEPWLADSISSLLSAAIALLDGTRSSNSRDRP